MPVTPSDRSPSRDNSHPDATTLEEATMHSQRRPAVVELRCAFDRPVDPATQRAIRDSLREFFQAQPGYLWDSDGTAAWSAGLGTSTSYTSTWASEDQALDAAEQARVWRDRNAGGFGWATCDITVSPEHDD